MAQRRGFRLCGNHRGDACSVRTQYRNRHPEVDADSGSAERSIELVGEPAAHWGVASQAWRGSVRFADALLEGIRAYLGFFEDTAVLAAVDLARGNPKAKARGRNA